jgi:hypothetical protein
MFILSFCAGQNYRRVLIDTVYSILHVFLVLGSDDNFLVFTNTELYVCVCVVTVQGVGRCMSSSCPHQALYCVFHTHGRCHVCYIVVLL